MDGDSPDDLDPFSSRRPAGGSRPSRFKPHLKGKVKSEPSAADAAPLPPPVVGNKEVAAASSDSKEAEDVAMVTEVEPPSAVTPGDAVDPVSDPMEVDAVDEEDTLVREIEVFFKPAPLDEDTQLYVMQYPLRPSWRPYELNTRCEEVRVKPKQSKLEVDLNLDVDCENYEPDVAENLRIQKQTLVSTEAPLLTDYAVGIMIGNQLHVNPVHAVVQLRTSLAHVSEVQKKKLIGRIQEVRTGEENIAGSSKSSIRQREKKVSEESSEVLDDDEPWVPLEYHATDTHLSGRYLQKMVAEGNNQIQFTMTPSEFVNSLCPGTSTSRIIKAPPKRVFESMPLEERIKKWLTQVSQVSRFSALAHLSFTNSNEELLKVLQHHACLVQGLWVSKSSLLCELREARVRDYILLLFSKNRVINKEKLKAVKISDDALRKILRPLAKERPVLNDWKFKEDTDESFKKLYPHIVEEQSRAWSGRENEIMDLLRAPSLVTKNLINPNMAMRGNVSGKVDLGVNRGKDGPASSATTMSNEAREALPKALLKLFQQQKVLSLSSITRELRDTALRKSSLRKEDQEKETFVNAANGVSAPLPELKSVISKLAVDIHGRYVLKTVGNQEIDPLRNVVINLFLEREPNAMLQKQEIVQAAMLILKKDISNSEFNQVMNELCVGNKGSWVLKTGD